MLKNQKGITLIALVITIIVLLILAGITITMLSSQDSAPNKAAEAKIMNDVGTAKDAVGLKASEAIQEWYSQKYTTSTAPTSTSAGAAVLAATYTSNGVSITPSNDNPPTGYIGKLTILSNEAKPDGKKYQVIGNVDSNGGIAWQDGTWETVSGT